MHPSITENLENTLMKRLETRASHILVHKSHNASISVKSNLFHNIVSKE